MPNPAQIGKAVDGDTPDASDAAKAAAQARNTALPPEVKDAASKPASDLTADDMQILGLSPVKPMASPKADPAAAAQQALQPGLGQPPAPGDSGPAGTAPVEGKPIYPFKPGELVNPTPTEAGILGLSGSDVPVTAPPSVAPAVPGETMMASAPTTKDMIRHLLTDPVSYKEQKSFDEMYPEKPKAQAEQASTFNFGDFLKGAGGKLGDFLQRWGMGLQGAPEGKTQGDIQREQAFELKKQQTQAEVTARQQQLEQTYALDRMNIQNQMNLANLPVEAKINLQNRLAEMQAQFEQDMKMIPMTIAKEQAMRGMTAGADPAGHLLSQGQ